MANEVMIGNIGVAPADPRIAVVQPDRSTANAIEAAGGFAGQAVQGFQQGRTERAIRQGAQAYDVAGKLVEAGAKFDPDTGELLNESEISDKINTDLAAQIAAVQETSAQAFSRVKAGMEQGRRSGGNAYAGGVASASLYIENEIRKISALTPGFEDVVRQTARDILGFDPTGFGIRNILQVPKEADKADENPRIKEMRQEAEARVWRASINGINLSMEDALRQVTAQDSRATMRASLQGEIELGNLTSDAATTEYFQTLSNPLMNMLERTIAAIDPEGGSTFGNMNSADRTVLMKNQQGLAREQEYNEAVAFARSAALANGGRLTNQDLTRIREQVDRRWQGMDTFIDAMSRSGHAERWADELAKMANLQAWSVAPVIKFLNEGFNESIGLEFVKAMANTGSNSQLKLLIDRSPALFQATGGGDRSVLTGLVGQTLQDVFGGNNPVITGDPVVDRDFTREVVSDMWRRSSNNPEGRRAIANDLTTVQPEMAYAMFLADPAEFGKHLTPESWSEMRSKFGTEVEMYSSSVSQGIIEQLDTARDPVGMAGFSGDTRLPLYERLNNALTSIDNMGFVKQRDGKVIFTNDIAGYRAGATARGIAGSGSIGVLAQLGNTMFPNNLSDGATKRIAPLLVNDSMISRMNNGRIRNLEEFNEVFRRDAKAKALQAQIAVEEQRQSVTRAYYDREQQGPEAQQRFAAEQQQYVETLQGLLDLQQERNVGTFSPKF
jgi:hypothetical protein